MNHIEISENLTVLLERWQREELDEREALEEAERLVEVTDDPWPTLEDDPPERHLSYKVLDSIVDLPLKLITQDDIPFFLNVLSAKTKDEAQSAVERFSAYFSEERWQERREQLRGQAITEGGTKLYAINIRRFP